ncbi:MAG: glycogen synthase GlgA [Defluviitaleaceae bacterium]|nr:glycogen synthase GlgA [Defluviitaleaceae bacterium]
MSNHLKILFIASEAAPFVKSGGLGDVVGSLPHALRGLGAEVKVVLPKYGQINEKWLADKKPVASYEVHLDWRKPIADIFLIQPDVYAVVNDYYFNRENIYGYGDDFERFAFFVKAALQLLPLIDFIPDIIHFHDWQTGLGCIYLKDVFSHFDAYKNIKSVFTIHNLQYQGNFLANVLPQIDLNYGYFAPDKIEFYGNASFMKAGLTYADFLTTVSPTYAHQIQTAEYGYGMQGMLASRKHELLGILNGIDYNEYNPATVKSLAQNFNIDDMEGKAACKAHVQKMLGLPINPGIPIFTIISRLVEQKGIDIIEPALDTFMNHRDMQIIVLGNGHSHYEQIFERAAYYHPHKMSANIMFDADLAHQIYSAADFFLMPSLFEPCGLGQLIAMRYGAVPVVRNTGGLADTIMHYNYETGQGNGLSFNDYDAGALIWAVDEALSLFHNKSHYQKAQNNAMTADFSWESSAKQYIDLYNKLRMGN